MVKVQKINSRAFDKEVRQYQTKIRTTLRGQAIANALKEVRPDVEPTVKEVAYIHAVLAATENQKIDPGMTYVGMCVKYLFCLITPYSVFLSALGLL